MRWTRAKWIGVVGVVLAAVIVAAGWAVSQVRETTLGYVDVEILRNQFIVPEIDEPLRKETERLQAEFDERSKDLEDAEKRQLFDEYQRQLQSKQAEMVEALLPRIEEAIERVAGERGVRFVLDKKVVLFGGTDLTQDVLLKLGVRVGK
ncbi:MAG TPA: OmpH family outer membrane protein [Limnochordia bacterium]